MSNQDFKSKVFELFSEFRKSGGRPTPLLELIATLLFLRILVEKIPPTGGSHKKKPLNGKWTELASIEDEIILRDLLTTLISDVSQQYRDKTPGGPRTYMLDPHVLECAKEPDLLRAAVKFVDDFPVNENDAIAKAMQNLISGGETTTEDCHLIDDGETYENWLKEHPEGFVANTPASFNPHYFVIHRSSCSLISPKGEGGGAQFVERTYRKVACDAHEGLVSWAIDKKYDRGSIKNCGTCNPAAYEELVSNFTVAGRQGEYRTPQLISELMVALADPKPGESIGDPTCGTAGLLVEALNYLRKQPPEEAPQPSLQSDLLTGFDTNATVLKLGALNLILQGIYSPGLFYQDTLHRSFVEDRPEEATEAFDLILAEPPNNLKVDEKEIDPELIRSAGTSGANILFLELIMRMLKEGGRACVLVPEGVFTGSSKAHGEIRKKLVEDHRLEAIISLPRGTFSPFANHAASILYFRKTPATERIWFYDLGDQASTEADSETFISRELIQLSISRWHNRRPEEDDNRSSNTGFFIPVEEIRGNDYDLSINRYQDLRVTTKSQVQPSEILSKLKDLGTAAGLYSFDSYFFHELEGAIEYLDEDTDQLLGEVKQWALEDLCREITPGQGTKPEHSETGVPIVGPTDLARPELNLSSTRFITKEDHLRFNKRCQPRPGDILYSCAGASLGNAVIVGTTDPFSIQREIALIRPNGRLIIPEYLLGMLNSNLLKRQAKKWLQGRVTPRLPLTEIAKLKVPLPPLAEQREFALHISRIREVNQLLEKTKRLGDELLDAYVQQIFLY